MYVIDSICEQSVPFSGCMRHGDAGRLQHCAATRIGSGKLGTVDFPTSGSAKAQAHFLRGVAALHSFWYEVALEEFRESTKIEPDFMGYWGEAMAHNHPIWGDPQETEAARKVLANIRDTSKLTPRERAYVQAVQIVWRR